MLDTITVFWAKYGSDLLKGTWDTLVMTGISTIFAYLIGLPLGVILPSPTASGPTGLSTKFSAGSSMWAARFPLSF